MRRSLVIVVLRKDCVSVYGVYRQLFLQGVFFSVVLFSFAWLDNVGIYSRMRKNNIKSRIVTPRICPLCAFASFPVSSFLLGSLASQNRFVNREPHRLRAFEKRCDVSY